MKNNLIGAVAAVGLALLTPAAANALTWTSLLEYKDGGSGVAASPSPFGTVTIEQLDANKVQVTVTLANAASLFINTGGPHDPFLFSTMSDDVVAIQPPVGSFVDSGHGAFQATPFGTFTDKIGCCLYPGDVSEPDVYAADVLGAYRATVVVLKPNGQIRYRVGDVISNPNYFQYGVQEIIHHAGDPIVGHSHVAHHAGDEANGASHGQAGPLVFTISNAAGISFAGLDYLTDADGKLIQTGTGEHFVSNAGGWWFSADIFDGATGQTYNVAARDAFGPPPGIVPEPATWAMMLLGFGGVGALLRRNRRLARTALA
ncbi:MAG: hypothetical protein JWQ29_1265 [Phenylobacterium sp.]|nr:hypothetical protein [Phenylobacterium sp.]